jgi:hypothetical protein
MDSSIFQVFRSMVTSPPEAGSVPVAATAGQTDWWNRAAESPFMIVAIAVLLVALCVTVFLHVRRGAAEGASASTKRRTTWVSVLVALLLLTVLSLAWHNVALRWITLIALFIACVWLLATGIREGIGKTADAVARATNADRRREEAEMDVPIEETRARGAALDEVLDEAIEEREETPEERGTTH